MKKLIALLLVLVMSLSICFALSGCDRPKVRVDSALSIDGSFAGTRTVTVVYPLSADIDSVKDALIADAPSGVSGAEFSYLGVEEDGYYFELKLTFRDKGHYEAVVTELIGRPATAFLSIKDTALTHGTRMAEDFDVSELISWMVLDSAANDATKGLEFDYSANSVKIGAAEYTSGSTVDINDCEGSEINSVSIKTSNDKEGTYSRTFTFSVPNSTYIKAQKDVESYFLSNTSPEAQYSGWISEGSNMIYTAIFEKLDADKLAEVTSMLLDTDSVEIFYGDRDNSSTPLSEGLTFEENLDTFSFIGADNGFPKLEYSYSLPTSTTHGDGSVFVDGKWTTAGSWEDGVYRVELDGGSAKLRIPDGIQYFINGVNFRLTSLGDSRFRRDTEFLYSLSDGADAVNYAVSYFASKGVPAETGSDEENLICKVSAEGTAEEITSTLVKLFGSGNFMAYRQRTGFMELTVKTELTDYVNLGYMMNSVNANRPMTYYVSSDGGENIVSISVDGAETAYAEKSASSLPIVGGVGAVEYHGNIPITLNIIIYIIVGALLLGLTAFICIMLLKPKKRRPAADPLNNPEAYAGDPEPDPDEGLQPDDPSLRQTTTFSIFELNALAHNKKYVDEINKDVEERMHAQSLEEQKQDIRARELEEMSRKVYGDPDAQNEQGSTDTEPQDSGAPVSDVPEKGESVDD